MFLFYALGPIDPTDKVNPRPTPQGQPLPAARAGKAGPDGQKKLYATYLQVLQTLAAGDAQAAKTAIMELEFDLPVQEPGKYMPSLDKAKRVLVRELAARNTESIVPVMALYHDLAIEYDRRGNFAQYESSSRLAIGTSELYLHEVQTETARDLACDILASLAGEQLTHGSLEDARVFFEEAIRLDPEFSTALLGRGAIFEVIGRYDLAIADFSRLRNARPGHFEASLRLGVNLSRLGKRQHAVKALQECLNKQAPRWVAVVASQELARVLVVENKIDDAVKILIDAIGQFPEQDGLVIQLAHVFDLKQQPLEARKVLKKIGVPKGESEAPRFHYSRWPLGELDAARGAIARAAADRLGALSSVLQTLIVDPKVG